MLGLAYLSAGPAAFGQAPDAPTMTQEQARASIELILKSVPPDLQKTFRGIPALQGLNLGQTPAQERSNRYPTPTDFSFAYIDKSGKIKIQPPLHLAESFHDGVAVVQPGDFHRDGDKWIVSVESPQLGKTYRDALLHTDGHITWLDGKHKGSFSKDALLVVREPFFGFNLAQNGKERRKPFCLIDAEGKAIMEGAWQQAQPYSEGLLANAELLTDVPMPKMGLTLKAPAWGYVDKADKQVIANKFQWAEPFSEDMAAVVLIENLPLFAPKYRYIDRSGEVKINGPFGDAKQFSSGMAAVADSHGKWGYIDKQGKQSIECLYDWVGPFGGDLAPVEKDKMVGFIDKTGEVKIPFKYKLAREFADGLAPATEDGTNWGFIDTSGNFVIEAKFKNAFSFNSGLALVYAPPSNQFVPQAGDAPLLVERASDRFDLNEARACCKLAIQLAPGSSAAIVAQRLLNVGLPQNDVCDEANKLYMEGITHARKGEVEAAADAYKKTLALEPQLFLADGSLASLALASNNYQEAEELLKKAVSINPKYARGYWRLSTVYKNTNRTAQAEQALAKAKELDPGDPYFNEQ